MARTVEIDETELLASQQTVKAVQAMLANPKARKLVLQAQKIINPEASIPEIDAAAPVNEELQRTQAELAAMRKEIADDKAERALAQQTQQFAQSWERQKNSLRKDGWTDEGIAEIEKLAQEKGIADLEIAAAYHEKLHPPAQPVEPSGALGFSMFEPADRDGEDMKKMLESEGNDEMALRGLINQGLSEVRGTARR